jgi:hypothetical protein
MTSIIASGGGNSGFKQVEAGTYNARCIKVVDLGTQQSNFNGEISWRRQILVIWELPSELKEDTTEPLTISKFYTLSLHEKSNLGIDLTSWRGRSFTEKEKQGFDITKLLGVPCMLNVIEGNNGKSKVGSLMPLPKGTEIAEQITPSLSFAVDDYQNGKKEAFNQLSEGIRNIILRAKEFEGIEKEDNGTESAGGDDDLDHIPF